MITNLVQIMTVNLDGHEMEDKLVNSSIQGTTSDRRKSFDNSQKSYIQSLAHDFFEDIKNGCSQAIDDIEAARDEMGFDDVTALHDLLLSSLETAGHIQELFFHANKSQDTISEKLVTIIHTTYDFYDFLDAEIITYKYQYPDLSDSLLNVKISLIERHKSNFNNLYDEIVSYYNTNDKKLSQDFIQTTEYLEYLETH